MYAIISWYTKVTLISGCKVTSRMRSISVPTSIAMHHPLNRGSTFTITYPRNYGTSWQAIRNFIIRLLVINFMDHSWTCYPWQASDCTGETVFCTSGRIINVPRCIKTWIGLRPQHPSNAYIKASHFCPPLRACCLCSTDIPCSPTTNYYSTHCGPSCGVQALFLLRCLSVLSAIYHFCMVLWGSVTVRCLCIVNVNFVRYILQQTVTQIPDFNPSLLVVMAAWRSFVSQSWQFRTSKDWNVSQGYVGYDPALATIIVAHQGTDSSAMYGLVVQRFVQVSWWLCRLPLVTDADFFLDNLDSNLFPGINSSIKVHDGFGNAQAR